MNQKLTKLQIDFYHNQLPALSLAVVPSVKYLFLFSDGLKSKDLLMTKFRLLRGVILALIRQAQVEGVLARKGEQLKEQEPYKFPSKEFQ